MLWLYFHDWFLNLYEVISKFCDLGGRSYLEQKWSPGLYWPYTSWPPGSKNLRATLLVITNHLLHTGIIFQKKIHWYFYIMEYKDYRPWIYPSSIKFSWILKVNAFKSYGSTVNISKCIKTSERYFFPLLWRSVVSIPPLKVYIIFFLRGIQ